MKPLFAGAGEIEQVIAPARLELLQAQLHEAQATSLIEVQVEANRQVVLLYAHGTLAGAYQLAENRSEPFPLTDVAALWNHHAVPVRKVDLPDAVGRMAWLACESMKRESYQVTEASWADNLRHWKSRAFNGLVSLTSDSWQGYVLFQHGDEVTSETVFFHAQAGCVPNAPFQPGAIWEAAILMLNSETAPHRCLHLRQSICRWGGAVLESYQHIAGRKFLQVTEHDIQAQIRPWRWNILVKDKTIHEQHFFAGVDAAAHAYRALFMEMGAQMSFAIGGYLTQRILSDMFQELDADERAALESQQLIPAAFTE